MSALISGASRLSWKFTGATHECLNVFHSLWCCWCLWAAADGGGRRQPGTAFMIWMSRRLLVTESQWMESNTCCLGADERTRCSINGGNFRCRTWHLHFALLFPAWKILVWFRFCVLRWCLLGSHLLVQRLFSYVDMCWYMLRSHCHDNCAKPK